MNVPRPPLWLVGAGFGAAGLLWALGRSQQPAGALPSPATAATGQVLGTVIGYEGGKPVNVTLTSIGNGKALRSDVAAAYLRMKSAAAADSIQLVPNSAFRTKEEQERLYRLYLAGQGNLAAAPGFSNHQNGRAVDLNTGTGPTGYLSKVYLWLAFNAGRYGFKNDVKGEPWHWTFYS